MNPVFQNLSDINAVEKIPGYHGRFLHNGVSTVAFWNIDGGAAIPEHSHPHAQVMHVLGGSFELTVNGETRILNAGDIVDIQPHVKHSGRSITGCKVIDVFTPERADYK